MKFIKIDKLFILSSGFCCVIILVDMFTINRLGRGMSEWFRILYCISLFTYSTSLFIRKFKGKNLLEIIIDFYYVFTGIYGLIAVGIIGYFFFIKNSLPFYIALAESSLYFIFILISVFAYIRLRTPKRNKLLIISFLL